ncbi:MAG: 3-deoxy-8-phosphooctulonate synthase [Bacteroidales bacterium]|nr:MAG: 3-deoxy-8-phosphooctulonate synthase [Bacteroidales bacterium]
MHIKKLIPGIKYSDYNFFLIAGPCVVEDKDLCFYIAESIARISDKLKIPYIFKASYKKANRTKLDSFAGIGDIKALGILKEVKEKLGIPVLTDIHSVDEATLAAEYVDVLQIPAFLCRQTELLVAAAKTGKAINIKKGQFMSPDSMKFAADKVVLSGNNKVMLTERGTMFGYQDLIIDYRGIIEMKKLNFPVVLDITHSLQQPNQNTGVSGGHPELVETVARAGIAIGVDGIFMETHPEPSRAKSDGLNMIKLTEVENLLTRLVKIRGCINEFEQE